MKKILALLTIVLVATMAFACSKTITVYKPTASNATTTQSSASTAESTSASATTAATTASTKLTNSTSAKPTTATTVTTKPTTATTVTTKPTTATTVTTKPTTATTVTTKPTTATTVTTKPTTATTVTTKPTTATTVTTKPTASTTVTTTQPEEPPLKPNSVITKVDKDGNVIEKQYINKNGLLVQKELMSYDENGRMTEHKNVYYEYNKYDKLVAEKYYNVTSSGRLDIFSSITYSYDDKLNLVRKEYKGLGENGSLRIENATEYVYDYSSDKNGVCVSRGYYEYNEKGNAYYAEIYFYENGVLSHSKVQNFVFNTKGNVTLEKYTITDSADNVTETGKIEYTYNAMNKLIKSVLTRYDANGNVIEEKTQNYNA